MAELLECRLCGYKTVRCGMTNHLKNKHPSEWANENNKMTFSDSGPIERLTISLGKVKNWSKDRTQEVKVK